MDWRQVVPLGILAAAGLWAQQPPRSLKAWAVEPAPARPGILERQHRLIRPEGEISAEWMDRLEARGVRFLEALPDGVFVVSLPGGETVPGALRVTGKISRLMDGSPRVIRTAVVDLHRDVNGWSMRRPAVEDGLEVVENPDLLPHQLMVRGRRGELRRFAARDEVNWLYPAAPELEKGEPVVACAGPIVSGARPLASSNLAMTYGDGWDGKGLGAAVLKYFFHPVPAALPASPARSEMLRALSAWGSVAALDFTPGSFSGQPRQIDILFARGNHGDGYSFDGRGAVLAHTFYPPPNLETIAGDFHLDLDETWTVGGDPDVFSVALHELGHALGLGHSDDPNAVMYPWYRRTTGLRSADITAIHSLYAARSGSGTPPSRDPSDPGAGDTPVTPPSNPDPPATPTTPPTPTTPSTDKTAPTLVIVGPARSSYTTTASTVRVSGTAGDNVGVNRVEWSATSGGRGVCTGASAWSTPAIAVYRGINTITVRAYDQAGNSAWRTLTVTRR